MRASNAPGGPRPPRLLAETPRAPARDCAAARRGLARPAGGRRPSDAAVERAWRTAPVAVAGRDPQRAVRGLGHVPDAPGLAVEKLLPRDDVAPTVQLQPPPPLAAQSRE